MTVPVDFSTWMQTIALPFCARLLGVKGAYVRTAWGIVAKTPRPGTALAHLPNGVPLSRVSPQGTFEQGIVDVPRSAHDILFLTAQAPAFFAGFHHHMLRFSHPITDPHIAYVMKIDRTPTGLVPTITIGSNSNHYNDLPKQPFSDAAQWPQIWEQVHPFARTSQRPPDRP